MKNKRILFLIFILVSIVQLYIPAKMIWNQEKILKNGVAYKFKTAPVDPIDPFRGKYITLNYQEVNVKVENEKDWNSGEIIYVSLTTDVNGYAKIKSASKEKPNTDEDFLSVQVRYVSDNGLNQLSIVLPFDRFYMEESKAYDAERLYQEIRMDSSQTVYALVAIEDGNAVLKDVLIDEISMKEVVKSNRAKE